MSRFRIPFQLSASQQINAPKETVRKHISTFAAQQVRSPRLVMERSAKTWIEGDTDGKRDGDIGTSSHREGERIGSGYQRIEKIIEGERLETYIEFLSPRKSEATASMSLAESESDDGNSKITTITREMHSSLPWYLFWMKGMMIRMISQDYRRGLTMLQTLAETGALHTQTTYDGETDIPQLIGIGIKNSAYQAQIGEAMRADYTELHDFLTSKGVPMSGGFSLYTKTDMKIGFFEFVSCVMVDTPRDSLDLPAHISRQEVPAGRYLSATHTGEYVYLGNARSAVYRAAQALKKRVNSRLPSIERYITDPHSDIPKEEGVTQVLLPMR